VVGLNKAVSSAGIELMFVKKVISGAGLIEKTIPSVCIALLAILITAISTMRYAFSYSILGLEEFTVVVALYLYFLGSAIASGRGRQIRVNILDSVSIPPRVRSIIDIFVKFVAFMVCFIFSYHMFDYTQWTIERQITIEPLPWPQAIVGLSLAIGLLLMGVHHLVQFIQALRKVRA